MYVYAPKGWAAMTAMVSIGLQPPQYAMAFGFLSTSSRMGDLASKLVLGWAVGEGWTWRSLFLAAAALQFVVAIGNLILLPEQINPPSKAILQAAPMIVASGAGGIIMESSSSSSSPIPEHDGNNNKPSQRSPVVGHSNVLWNTVNSERFWCIALGVAALHVIMEFDKYIPLYLHKSLHLSPGLAAQGAALYPLSQLIALALAGYAYERLTAL